MNNQHPLQLKKSKSWEPFGRIFIFSIVLGAECLSYLKSIETQASAFLTLIILSIGTVSPVPLYTPWSSRSLEQFFFRYFFSWIRSLSDLKIDQTMPKQKEITNSQEGGANYTNLKLMSSPCFDGHIMIIILENNG